MLDIIKIVIILVVMMVLIRRKLDLIYTLLAGIILTGLFFNHVLGLFTDFYLTLTDIKVLKLMFMFFFVFYLSNLMDASGVLKKMLASLEKVIKDVRFVIISLPFMIGLVPAPSGAVLSAPFVQEVGTRLKLSPERKLVINYWFRHTTEYINPIMPGVILYLTLLGISFKSLFILNIPVMIFVFALGFFMFVYKLDKTILNDKNPGKKDIKNIINGIFPIFITILLPVVFGVEIILSLFIGILSIIIVNRVKFRQLIPLVKKSIKIDLLIMVFLVMLFKTVMENSKAIELVSNSFIAYGFPTILLVVLIPLLIGLLTGITIGYIGIGIPLILPFLKAAQGYNMGFVMLAFASGFIGVLASPTHLCLSVTQKYFNARYDKIYKLMVPSLVIFLVFILILNFIGWPLY
ncbi:MAG: DUF401 family protein [Nanoarchaeota archaeon]